MANAALLTPFFNYLAGSVLFSDNAWAWIGGNVIAGILACMWAAWCLGRNLVVLEIRRAESEESKDELRPLRKTIGTEVQGRVVIHGAVVGLGGSILSLSLGPFLKFAVVLVGAYIAGLFVYDKVAALVQTLCIEIRSSHASTR